ncbi:hypothetical protein EV189_1880 [Motilibacter rhizosphaerae]|uniref:Uncharacterized protein n=2 Tax=Motilibacter rhizosphaerae TaxID=598652 RepID=A0A4Q7NSM0_9ACTN|nr:hypothetical protein EV189_1880 [Motilibacter rhizosphaerae]
MQAFYRMDSAQRAVTVASAAYSRLEPGPDAGRMAAELAPLDAEAEQVAARYIATLDRFDLELPSTDPAAAVPALDEATWALEAAATRLEQLQGRYAPALERADRALVEATARVQEARAALERARSAVAALDPVPHDVADLLRGAEQAAQGIAGGAVQQGPEAARRAAEEVRRSADRVVQAASTLGERSAALERRLASLGVRVDAVAYRAEALAPDLSTLRRDFVEPSWRDVEGALAAARPLLAALPDRVADLRRLLHAGEVGRAEEQVRQLVSDLERAEAAVDGVGRRLQALRAVESRPREPLERARFAVRDAQRLVVGSGKEAPRPAWVARLDGLVARLEQLEHGLGVRGHRDWWAYAAELGSIERTAAQVVDDVRRARGR